MAGKKLTEKQKLFVAEYLKDLNATQAYKRAGYSVKSDKAAATEGGKLLRNPVITAAIQEAQNKRIERTQIDADYVLNRLVEIDKLDVLDIFTPNMSAVRPLNEWPEAWRRSIGGIDVNELFDYNNGEREMAGLVKKIKWPDKTRNLELLGKHINVQAFKEKVDMNTTATHNVMVVPSAGSVDDWEEQAKAQQAEILGE